MIKKDNYILYKDASYSSKKEGSRRVIGHTKYKRPAYIVKNKDNKEDINKVLDSIRDINKSAGLFPIVTSYVELDDNYRLVNLSYLEVRRVLFNTKSYSVLGGSIYLKTFPDILGSMNTEKVHILPLRIKRVSLWN